MSRLVCLIVLCGLVGCQAAPKPDSDVNKHIVGGHDTDISKYPWQVSFREGMSHICGGSILNQNWIITAGHCVDGMYSARYLSIKVGATSKLYGGKVHQVKAIFAHPKFNIETMTHDVALLQLSTPITFSDSIKPIRIASKEPSAGDKLTVTGWGDLEYDEYGGAPSPDRLQAVEVPAVSEATCKRAYRRGLQIDNSMFCAGETGKDACQGDSGGPIVNSNNEQVGIVSWGKGCAFRGYYGVYTKLANSVVRSWIKSKTGL